MNQRKNMKIKPISDTGRVALELDPNDDRLMEKSIKDAEMKGWPFQIKTILVPLDFSSFSRQALASAIPLAQKFGAKLVLVHVYQPVAYPDAFAMSPAYAALDARLHEELKDTFGPLAQGQNALLSVETIVRIGRSCEEIVNAAKSVNADIIVIATHGHTGLKHVLLGSTTELVVRHADCPVLVVRERQS
jgi:universal stress protein A